MKSVKTIPLILLLLIQMASCSDSNDSTTTVASVGEYNISFEDLDLSFKLKPMYAIRTPYRIARHSQLNFLIENKYYLITAKQVDLTDDQQVQQRLQYIADQEVIKAHLRDSFFNRVTLSADEQKAALNKWSEKRRVNFLHSDSRATADSLRRMLAAGKDIDLLAAQLRTTAQPHISGGEVGEITFGDMDETMEKTIYSLQPGQFSEVIESTAGYLIFQVSEMRQNTDILDMDLKSRLNYVNRILRNRKMDRQIREHLRSLSRERKIAVNNRLIDVLLEAVVQATAGKPAQQNPFTPQISNKDLEQVQLNIHNVDNETIAQFGDLNLSLGEYLMRITGMPPLQRPNLSTRNRLIQSIIDMVRDDLLLQDAIQGGIPEQDVVQKSIAEKSDDYLAGEMQQRIGSQVFRKENPGLWQHYSETYQDVRENTVLQISELNLFPDISNPDSVLAPPPVMLFMRDRYIW
jgi:hypothetical protein